MPKKSKSSSSNYQHFKLHGNHSSQKVFVLVLVVLAVALVLGYLYQPNIAAFLGVPAGY